jgi:hypothetical protein
MELYILVILVIVLIAIIRTVINERIADKKTKKETQNKPAEDPLPTAAVVSETTEQNTTNRTGTEILTDFLTQMGCIVEHSEVRDEWTYRVFLYQGAYFESFGSNKNDEILLYYYWTIPYSKENMYWVQHICHQLNSESKYSKVFYRYDSEGDKFDVCIQTSAIGPSIEVLKLFVHITFECARRLQLEYERHCEGGDITPEQRMEDARKRVLHNRCKQYNEPVRLMANYRYLNANRLSLGQAIKVLFDKEDVRDMLSLTIVSETGTEHIIQRDKIAAFDLFGVVVDGKGDDIKVSQVPVTITLDTTFYHYVMTLHLVEYTKENVFIRLAAMKVAYDYLQDRLPEESYNHDSVSCLLCYETDAAHSFESFGKAMETARLARRKGEELTEEQQDMLQIDSDKLAYQLKEGERLANHGCYIQAIELLEPLVMKYMEQRDGEHGLYVWTASSAAHHLGYCYYQLCVMSKAFYYLHFARKHYRHSSYLYIHLLYETHDVRLLDEIESELHKTETNMRSLRSVDGSVSELNQKLYELSREYYLFLYQIHALTMIRDEQIVAAYNDLNYLLQYEEMRDFAQAKIDELNEKYPM